MLHVATTSPTPKRGSTTRRPNFIILMVDDLGIGDIGCFGNTTIKTPNIDQLARDGVKFEHNLAPSVLCTPSRAAFLTGRHAVRSGMAADVGDRRVLLKFAIEGGLPHTEVTFAKLLQNSGYKTAFIGKWHLGVSCNSSRDFCHHPNTHGFDHFYGLPLSNFRECGDDLGVGFNNFDKDLGIIITSISALLLALYISKCSLRVYILGLAFLSLALSYNIQVVLEVVGTKWLSCLLMRNKDVVEQPVVLKDLTHRFVTESVHFIEKNQDDPFLLLMSFAKVHTALFTTEYFVNHSKHGRYGDNVEEMDWAVGKILQKIDDLNLRDETFVYFTSDHGPEITEISRDGEVLGGSQGIFRDGKQTNFEGGIRVPTIARWPRNINAGSKISTPTSSLDMYPTILKIANVEVPEGVLLDGLDISGMLTGTNGGASMRFLFHYCDKSLQAVTYADNKNSKIWKVHFAEPKFHRDTRHCYGDDVYYHDPPLVFELRSDPSESKPLDTGNSQMKNVIKDTLEAVKVHNASVKPAQCQLSLQTFYPWMQLCCNPPLCYCREEFPHELVPMP